MFQQNTLTSTFISNEKKPTLILTEIIKKYKIDEFINFLRKEEDLGFDDNDLEILYKQKVDGYNFFKLTKEEYMQIGLKFGPATRLVNFVKEINDKATITFNPLDPIKALKEDNSLYISTRDMLRKEPEFILSCEKLLSYLQQYPVQPIKIYPIRYNRYFQSEIFSKTLEKLFISSYNASSRIWDEFIINIAYSPTSGNFLCRRIDTTKESLYSFWDLIIIKPFMIGFPEGKYDRNTSLHISTEKLRPDFFYLIHDACLIRGEEKGFDSEDDLAKELIEKLVWTYGQCPYYTCTQNYFGVPKLQFWRKKSK
ncbi:hypothetical protein Glove_46g160 [Diversispora epigaea]|uniref:SAM domain-containing protein n=1 Tax=Diversispora epigaea TaxID=1348612 RepID=A0A397JFD1_9GLOM|nr:hypothetical protein Glove_46g160 [Diversispora epigaea]